MNNPIIKLELLRRFRSPVAAWGIPLVVLLPGLAILSVYAVSTHSASMTAAGVMGAGGIGVDAMQRIGRGMFGWVVGLLAVTMFMLVPSLVGASIAGERHAQTLQPLQLTAVTPGQIVAGKLVASLLYLLVLMLCTAPILVIPFLVGGVAVSQLLGAFIVMFLVMIELAAISLAVSATFSSPAVASIVSVVACWSVTIAPFVLTGVLTAMLGVTRRGFDLFKSPIRYIVGVSPVSLSSWVVGLDDGLGPNVVKPGDRLVSVFWFIVLTVLALWWARKKVTAPVDRDR